MYKILIVEDDIWIAQLMAQYLQSHQLEPILATRGLEAIRLTQLERPDLILLDMRLPQMSGWEITSVLKQNPEIRHIPIIAVSVAATQEEKQRGLELGCEIYLIKPLILSELLDVIKQFLPTT
jgi:two-component system, cell cycle response regulator DivK